MQRSGSRTLDALGAMTRILCVCALLFAGFAHTSPASSSHSASPQTGIDLSAFAMPDGTLPVICRSASGPDDRGGSASFFSDCEFCRISATAILPPCAHFRAPQAAVTGTLMPAASGAGIFPVHEAGKPTRGPPFT